MARAQNPETRARLPTRRNTGASCTASQIGSRSWRIFMNSTWTRASIGPCIPRVTDDHIRSAGHVGFRIAGFEHSSTLQCSSNPSSKKHDMMHLHRISINTRTRSDSLFYANGAVRRPMRPPPLGPHLGLQVDGLQLAHELPEHAQVHARRLGHVLLALQLRNLVRVLRHLEKHGERVWSTEYTFDTI